MSKAKPFMEELALVCKAKKYSKDAFSIITIICCSDQMHGAGYTSEQALKIAIELVKTKEKKKVYSELLKLTGFDENEDNDGLTLEDIFS